MQMQRNNLAWSADLNCGLAIIEVNPIVGRLVDATGAQIGPDFPIAASGAHTAWPVIAAAADRFAVVYCAGDLGANPRRLRFVIPTLLGTGTSGSAADVSEEIDLLPLGAEVIWSELSPVAWHAGSQSFLVSSRVPSGVPGCPKAVLQRVQLDGTVSAPLELTDDSDYRSPRAIVPRAGNPDIVKVVGWQAGIPQGYAGGTWYREVNVAAWRNWTTLAAIAGGHQDQSAAGELVAWVEGGGVVIDNGYVRFHYPGAGDLALSEFHATLGTSLVLAKGPEARLQAFEVQPDGKLARPDDTLVLTYWDGLVKEWQPSVCCVPGGWLVSFGWSRLVKVRGVSGTALRALNVEPPAPPPPPPPPMRSPTIPVQVEVNSPRWDVMFFERNHYAMEPSPAAAAVLVHRPYSPPAWESFVSRGPAKPVLADFHTIDSVPAEYRLALNTTLEGGPEGPAFSDDEARRRAVLDGLNSFDEWWRTRTEKAIALQIPMVFYLDGGFMPDGPGVTGFLDKYMPSPDRLPEGLEIIPVQMCYPHKVDGVVEDLAVTAPRWRRGLQHLRDRGFQRLAIARTLYTRSDEYPLEHIEACQPIIGAVANEFRVTLDMGFSWARPSGVIAPHQDDPTKSNRAVLEPWVKALAEATATHPRPPRLVETGPQLLKLLASPTTGTAPLEVAFSIHEPSGELASGLSFELWKSWEGMPWERHAITASTRPSLRLTVPGRYLIEARRVAPAPRPSEQVVITVARAESKRKPSNLKFCG